MDGLILALNYGCPPVSPDNKVRPAKIKHVKHKKKRGGLRKRNENGIITFCSDDASFFFSSFFLFFFSPVLDRSSPRLPVHEALQYQNTPVDRMT